MSNENGHEEHQKSRTVLTFVQSCLICVLIVLVIIIMAQINRLQGTARVINYAGLVRGATQRLIKLEIAEQPNDSLMLYLDEIMLDLKYGEGKYELVSLDSVSYQGRLDRLMSYWENLKKQIIQVREHGYVQEDMNQLVDMSEMYFELADATVSAAEIYSDKIAKQIRMTEILSVADMCLLLCLVTEQTLFAMRIRRKNIVLEKKAYVDIHTGLQNKNMCEELLAETRFLTEPTACLVFDINNLKLTNDTYGHLAGDRLIADFAEALKEVVRSGDFAGRCGGDEFMIVLYEVEEGTARDVLKRLRDRVDAFNRLGRNLPISYAYGWSLSTDYEECTMSKLFDAADHSMYMNKERMKTILKKVK